MTRQPSPLEKILRAIDPSYLARYLLRNGYRLEESHSDAVHVYHKQQAEVLLVPANNKAVDYPRAVANLIEAMTTPTLSFDDVLGLIVVPDCDIVRYQVEGADATWGQLRLGYVHEATHALYDVLRYSAAGVSTARTDYTNVSEQAKAFSNTCRFGQTEYGSFVMKVFCPTNPLAVSVDREAPPFGRQVTRATVENLEFLASESASEPSTPLPPAMNSQVASAVMRLKPGWEFASTGISVRFTAILTGDGAPISDESNESLEFGPFIYARAQSVRDRLKKALESGREVLTGFITDLHKDRPTSREDVSRQITIDAKYGGTRRKVTMRLTPADYSKAVKWHDAEDQVKLDALLDKRGRPWSVARLYEFTTVAKQEQGELFTQPE